MVKKGVCIKATVILYYYWVAGTRSLDVYMRLYTVTLLFMYVEAVLIISLSSPSLSSSSPEFDPVFFTSRRCCHHCQNHRHRYRYCLLRSELTEHDKLGWG